MIGQASPWDRSIVELLRRFFDPETNGFTRSDISQDKVLRALVDRLKGASPNSTVLPWTSPNGSGETYLYGLARDSTGLHHLREVLRSFLGESYATAIEARAVPLRTSPLADAVLSVTNGNVLRIKSDWAGAREMLGRWLQLEDQRPLRVQGESRATSLLLRDFDLALQVGNAEGAEDLLRALREGKRLNALNQYYLQMKYWGAFARWHELLEWPGLTTVVQSRRPAAVTDLLLDAIYHVHLSAALRERKMESARELIRELVIPVFARLLHQGVGRTSKEAWTVEALASTEFMLMADSADSDNFKSAAAVANQTICLLEQYGGETWIAAELRGLLPLTFAELDDSLEEAWRLFQRGHYSDSFERVRSSRPTPEGLRLLLLLSEEIQEYSVDTVVAEAYESVPEGLFDWEEPRNARRFADVIGRLVGAETDHSDDSGRLPTDWLSWFEWIATDSARSPHKAISIARQGASSWLISIEGIDPLLKVLNKATLTPAHTEALPYLVRSIDASPDIRSEARSAIARAIQQALLYGDVHNDDVVRLWIDLLPDAFASALGPNQYTEIVGSLVHLLTSHGGLPPLDRVLDALAFLALAPCPDDNVRKQYISVVIGLANRYSTRWQHGDWDVLRQIGHELQIEMGIEAVIPQADANSKNNNDIWLTLSNCKVGVYTLTPGVGQLFRSMLQKRVPDVRVEHNADHVETAQLAALAKSSDIFLMATSSAKHMATECIEKHRGNLPLLKPAGKGVSSMWRALDEYVKASHR